MLQLRGQISEWEAEPFVVRLTENSLRPPGVRCQEGLLVKRENGPVPAGFRCCFRLGRAGRPACEAAEPIVELPEPLSYLCEGDILYVDPREGRVTVLYRRNSKFNVIFATERCNNNCIMCSQPPRKCDDRWLVQMWSDAIPLMDRSTSLLCISGGEPTLLGADLIGLVQRCKSYLPNTSLLMLSNGRMFSYVSLCRELAAVQHPDLVVAVPLHSDLADQHEFIAQSEGAYDQTIRGIVNLKRCGLRIEIRLVIHRAMIDRLPKLASFIGRNLPFADHIALMGLELTGHARANDGLWIDPLDYEPLLRDSVAELKRCRLPVSIYNHPLCQLSPELWSVARQSISDWKDEFADECTACPARERCCGMFASSQVRLKEQIQPIDRQKWELWRDCLTS
jgi:His-Xaa-Ser system radical SAM maturase HxsC